MVFQRERHQAFSHADMDEIQHTYLPLYIAKLSSECGMTPHFCSPEESLMSDDDPQEMSTSDNIVSYVTSSNMHNDDQSVSDALSPGRMYDIATESDVSDIISFPSYAIKTELCNMSLQPGFIRHTERDADGSILWRVLLEDDTSDESSSDDEINVLANYENLHRCMLLDILSCNKSDCATLCKIMYAIAYSVTLAVDSQWRTEPGDSLINFFTAVFEEYQELICKPKAVCVDGSGTSLYTYICQVPEHDKGMCVKYTLDLNTDIGTMTVELQSSIG